MVLIFSCTGLLACEQILTYWEWHIHPQGTCPRLLLTILPSQICIGFYLIYDLLRITHKGENRHRHIGPAPHLHVIPDSHEHSIYMQKQCPCICSLPMSSSINKSASPITGRGNCHHIHHMWVLHSQARDHAEARSGAMHTCLCSPHVQSKCRGVVWMRLLCNLMKSFSSLSHWFKRT